ncbi:hypothetical protein Bca101_075475 [Brassica carinata]
MMPKDCNLVDEYLKFFVFVFGFGQLFLPLDLESIAFFGVTTLSSKTGAQIIYAKYSGTEVEFNDILKEDDIVGILETEDIRDLKPLND